MEQAVFDALTKTLIDILVPLVLLGILTVLGRVWSWLRLRMDDQQQAFVDTLVKQYVLAAEQYGLEGKIGSTGEEKFKWAMEKIEASLNLRGYPVDLDEITDHIVAKVHDEFNKLPPFVEIVAGDAES